MPPVSTQRPERVTAGVGFAAALAAFGEAVAVVSDDEVLTYAELARRVGECGEQLGPARRLVLLEGANEVGALVPYLAALAGGHPVLVTAPGRPAAALAASYDPDVVVGRRGGGWPLEERREASRHDLHDDLALLLSTSGSTGSPKLVRLSRQNVESNAAAIATYLGIGPDDRAVTSLPMHYCYGLSVLHSHLRQGATVVLSDRSTVDPAFWQTFRSAGATTFAAVPHTFELLERVGFDAMELPTLRTVTQAGGRLAPDLVRRYAELGRQRGWNLVVMYGQTEATARMAYLPPEETLRHPEAIGIPIPGGSFELAPVPGAPPDVGELVYRGPNVMLGYAQHPADLGRGRVTDALRTGDLARRRADGLYEIVGRRNRFVKPFGLRVDLDRVERLLADRGLPVACAGDDEGLVLAGAAASPAPAAISALAADLTGLPASRVRVLPRDVPRLDNGKTDYQGLLAAGRAVDTRGPVAPTDAVRRALGAVLGVDDVADDDTFVSLGGDSLSYVEVAMRLEHALGALPADWHTRPVGELTAMPGRRAAVAWVDTGIVLRAVAILLVVAGHVGLAAVAGGAHVLLAVAGANFARFQLTGRALDGRAGLWRSTRRVVVPTVVVTAAAMLLTDQLRLPNLLLVNNLVQGPAGQGLWRYWFLEALVQLLVVLAVVLSVPRVRRLEARRPFAVALVVLVGALALRHGLPPIPDGRYPRFMPHNVLWLFAAGWAAARASSAGQRLLVSAGAVVGAVGFFAGPERVLLLAAGLLVLVWVPRLPVPRPLDRIGSLVAGASLHTYLTHWYVLRLLSGRFPFLALLGSLVVGQAGASVERHVRRIARRAAPAPRWFRGSLRPCRHSGASASSI